MTALCLNQSGRRMPRGWIARWLSALGRALARRGHPGIAAREVTVLFAGPDEMRRLNREYRGKDKPTDVLSFAAVERGSIGELVVCPEILAEQGRETGLGARGELGYMLVHGVLHLLGHDHEEDGARRRMFALQDRLYSALEKSVGLG